MYESTQQYCQEKMIVFDMGCRMDPAVLVLESLEKEVANGQLGISFACQRVHDLIVDVAKDDSRIFFRQIVPKLLQFILGHHSSLGLLERVRDGKQAMDVKRLLDPRGELFSTLLHLQISDPVTRFEVPLSEFGVESIAASSPVTSTTTATTTAATVPVPETMKLDYCEFFYFHLVKIVTSFPWKESDKPGKAPSSLYRRVVEFGLGGGGTEKSCRWQHDLVAETYLSVLRAHLEFALPTATTKEHAFTMAQFRNKAQTASRLGEAFVGIIGQLWLGSNRPVRTLRPTIDMLHATETAVRHVCTAVCQASVLGNRFYSQAIETSFAGFRVHLYRFLRAALQEWPLEPHFSALVALWCSFVSPWEYVQPSQPIEYWHPYVLNNYLFYVVPFQDILKHLEASLEALVSIQLRTKLVLQGGDFSRRLQPSLDCLVGAVKAVRPVLDLIRSVEVSEVGPRRYSQYTEYRLLDQLAVLEPSTRTLPSIFDRAGLDRVMNLIRWVERASHSPLGSADRRLGERLLETQDELAHAFSVNDTDYEAFLQSQAALEEAEAVANRLTPRRRNLLPATPESRLGTLRALKSSSPASHYSDEIPILVTVLAWTSDRLNRLLESGFKRMDAPAWILHYARVDLRWLAVWQNLLFTLTTPLLLYALLKLIL